MSVAQCRNWIERDYQDLKGELGLDHFEGRSYVGWQHHVSMCLAAYAFLLAEQSEAFPPSAVLEALFALPARPLRRRGSRGSATAAQGALRTPRPEPLSPSLFGIAPSRLRLGRWGGRPRHRPSSRPLSP